MASDLQVFMIHKKRLALNCLQSSSGKWKLDLWYFHFLDGWAAKPLAAQIRTASPVFPVLCPI